MKKVLLALSLLTATCVVKSQTIPNSSFESWVAYSAFGERPTEWTTTDSITMSLSLNMVHSATKTTDASSGTAALRLVSSTVTVPILGTTINGPGIATNGKIAASVSSFTFDGGSPTAVRSRFFGGKFKYNPAGANDAAVFTVALLRRNTSTGQRDTVAFGSDTVNYAVSTYTPFSVALQYRDYLNNPDSCLILLQSSRGLNDPGWANGSELIVDELAFTGVVGLDEVSDINRQMTLYPSPANQQLNVKLTVNNSAREELCIMDATGKEVLRREVSSEQEQFDITRLPSGNYFLNLTDDKNKVFVSRKFVVAH